MRSLIFLLLFSSQAFGATVTYLFSGEIDNSWDQPTLAGFADGDIVDLYLTYDASNFSLGSGSWYEGVASSTLLVEQDNYYHYEDHHTLMSFSASYPALHIYMNNYDDLPYQEAINSIDEPYFFWRLHLAGQNTSGLTQDLTGMLDTPSQPHNLCVYEKFTSGSEPRACVQINSISFANPVPLPAGIYLFLSGLVGLGLMRGRND